MRINELMRPFDIIERRVRFAVELIDPITLELVHAGVTVTATNIETSPIVNLSGRFVWLGEQDALPDAIIVNPGLLPYEPETILNPEPVGSDVASREQDRRLIRVTLRPTTNYPFADGVTGIRGCLKDKDPPKPIGDAEIWLRWLDTSRLNGGWKDSSARTRSRQSGDFATVLRVPPRANLATLNEGILAVHLAVRHGSETRLTANFTKILEGRFNEIHQPILWNTLQPF